MTVKKTSKNFVQHSINFLSFILIIAPLFFVMGCVGGTWQSTISSGLVLFLLSTFGAGCRKLLSSPDTTENLLRFLVTGSRGGCSTPQDFTAGFDLSKDLTAAGDGFRIDGGYFPDLNGKLGEKAGYSVHSAGDVNGDGFDDLIVGAPANIELFQNQSVSNIGVAHVVFGSATPGDVDLMTGLAGSGKGFKIINDSLAGITFLGETVRGIGDINSDGLDDMIVGGYLLNAGGAYVIYGKSSASDVNVTAMVSTDGFAINASSSFTNHGAVHTLDGAGDFNGDGIDDFIVGVPGIGGARIIYGKPSGSSFADIDISTGVFTSGIEGLEITGAGGSSVAGAGDVNGDGLQDVIIGDPNYTPSTFTIGRAFVVFGQPGTPTIPIDLAKVASGADTASGFMVMLDDNVSSSQLGTSVGPAGDVNGDGFDDVVIGYGGSNNAALIYGSAAPTNVTTTLLLPAKGVVIVGPLGLGNNESVNTAGDINGDGLSDLLFGTPDFMDTAQFQGAGFVLFGDSQGLLTPNLASLGLGMGFAMHAPTIEASSYLGKSVSPAGDVNGDGCDDIILGAPGVWKDTNSNAGSSWVIFGGVQQ